MHPGNRPVARGCAKGSRQLPRLRWVWLATAWLGLWLLPGLALGQEPSLSLRLRREFGYGGLGEIQGRFRLVAQGPADLERVTFWMDAQVVHEVDQAPWVWTFHTDAFEEGGHTLRATGWTRPGLELSSETIEIRFVSAKGVGLSVLRMVLLLLGGIGVVLAISGTLTLWLSRGPKSGARSPARPWWSRFRRLSSPPVASTRPHTDAEPTGFRAHSPTAGDERQRWELEQSRYVDSWPAPSNLPAQAGFDKNEVLCDTDKLKGDDGNE